MRLKVLNAATKGMQTKPRLCYNFPYSSAHNFL